MTWLRKMGALGLFLGFAVAPMGCGDDEASTFECGDITCRQGQVCVQEDRTGPFYHCVSDPCVSEEPSCDCAGSVCEVGRCSSASERHVKCVCPVC